MPPVPPDLNPVNPDDSAQPPYEAAPSSETPPGAVAARYWELRPGDAAAHRAVARHARPVEGVVAAETQVSVYVNGQPVAAFLCSPGDQEALALGFLFTEGLIHGRDDVRLIRPNASGGLVDVFLRRADFVPPRRAVLTSGCGGGITFWDGLAALPPLETTFTTTPEALLARMQDLQDAAQLYRHARGVHTSILATPGRLLASAEDIGRHNTVDRLAGYALRHGLDTGGCLLLTSGRISSEMLVKARRMGVPVVASRTSPTSASLALAEDWRICLAGYVRRDRLRVYTHGWRLGLGE